MAKNAATTAAAAAASSQACRLRFVDRNTTALVATIRNSKHAVATTGSRALPTQLQPRRHMPLHTQTACVAQPCHAFAVHTSEFQARRCDVKRSFVVPGNSRPAIDEHGRKCSVRFSVLQLRCFLPLLSCVDKGAALVPAGKCAECKSAMICKRILTCGGLLRNGLVPAGGAG
jgi:hypothetical protein